jgi:VacB/RNase II family 3'-5' exoribonuclease
MPSHRITGPPLDFADLRRSLKVPGDFPADVVAQAERAAHSPVRPTLDRTDIPFVTVDPAGSRDLDQAIHIAGTDDGYLVSYAIADVAAFVAPGSILDEAVRQRGETLYFPDVRVPLHPAVLSEGAASLLPNEVRPAVLWQIGLDPQGEVTSTTVERALVRSRRQLNYVELQQLHDQGQAPDAVARLGEVGTRRQALSRARHAINLELPDQQVEPDADGGWKLQVRTELDVEAWNAEISLLTGMCAARIMLEHGIGILRTLPEPEAAAVAHLRRIAPALGIDWPPGTPPGDVLASVDRSDPRHVAFIEQAASLLRGAGYTPFDGAPPALSGHAGVGAPYAHVTAPLRRLVDRFASTLCVSLCAGEAPPEWIRSALPTLPAVMATADRLAHEVDRAVVDAMEAWLLQDRTGDTFDAIVLDVSGERAKILIDEPPVRANCRGHGLQDGAHVQVRLVSADVTSRTVQFEALGFDASAFEATGPQSLG